MPDAHSTLQYWNRVRTLVHDLNEVTMDLPLALQPDWEAPDADQYISEGKKAIPYFSIANAACLQLIDGLDELPTDGVDTQLFDFVSNLIENTRSGRHQLKNLEKIFKDSFKIVAKTNNIFSALKRDLFGKSEAEQELESRKQKLLTLAEKMQDETIRLASIERNLRRQMSEKYGDVFERIVIESQ